MNEHTLLESLLQDAGNAQLPTQADILVLQMLSQGGLQARARRFVSLLAEGGDCPHDGAGTLMQHADRTVAHLPDGARAQVYHASGALRYVSGLAPAQAAFARAAERVPERDTLVRALEERAHQLALSDWAGPRTELRFERLFQTRGQGVDPRTGQGADATLFRAIGAWRQYIDGIPVLGAASVALRLAGDGTLDGLALAIRPGNGEVLERAAVIDAEAGARQVVTQLAVLLGQKEFAGGLLESASLQFGHLDLGKRKPQRVLAPAYVARVVLRHKTVRQAYVLAVRATERAYLELPVYGSAAVVTRGRSEIGHCTPSAQ